MSEIIQYDTSGKVIDGINIAEAIQTDKKIVFNESYTVTGTRIVSPSIYACYDLTVVGDIDVMDIEVKGNLRVIGNIRAKRITCLKIISCSGNIDAEDVYAGEIVANDITCRQISCNGNIMAKTTIDVSDWLNTEKSVIAGEGIIGNGKFTAKNAIAIEYFDFHGDIYGKVIELESDYYIDESSEHTQVEAPVDSADTLDEAFAILKKKISEALEKAGRVNEEELADFVMHLSEIDKARLSDWNILTKKLIDISYLDKITNFRDYLIVILANRLLPDEIKDYETVEHVFSKLLVDAEKSLDDMEFHAVDMEELAYALKTITFCETDIKMEKDSAFDRVFQSIGIKYKTVKGFIG